MVMMRRVAGLAGVVCLGLLAACTSPSLSEHDQQRQSRYLAQYPKGSVKIGRLYTINGKEYLPAYQPGYVQEGIASWYGPNFHGKKTANGETYNQYAMTAAHTTLPMPSIVEVTNLGNGRTVKVRVNDRGPFASERIIDLSRAAADKLDMVRNGTAKVRVRLLEDETHRFIAEHYGESEAARMAAIASDAGGAAPSLIAVQPEAAVAVAAIAVPEEPRPVLGGEVITGQIQTYPQAASAEPAQPLKLGALDFAESPALPQGVITPLVQETRGEGFAVQAGAFRERANAEELAHRLTSYSRAYVDSANGWHRVRLGPFANAASAERVLGWMQRAGHEGSVVLAELNR